MRLVGTEILIGAGSGEYVPGDDDQFVRDRDDCFLLGGGAVEPAELADLPAVELAQVAVGAYGRPGAFDQPGLQVLVAFAAFPVMSFTRGFVVARTEACPRDASCCGVGNQPPGSAPISEPISEMTAAEACGPMPGMLVSRSRWGRKGAIISSAWASSLAIMSSRWSR
jgi:hypothetical protein